MILELLGGEDVTPAVNAENDVLDKESREAARRLRRRPNLDFEQMGIPSGSQLVAANTEDVAEVVSGRTVRCRGEESSLTAATRKVLGLPPSASVHSGRNWTFEGRSIREIYAETYPLEDGE